MITLLNHINNAINEKVVNTQEYNGKKYRALITHKGNASYNGYETDDLKSLYNKLYDSVRYKHNFYIDDDKEDLSDFVTENCKKLKINEFAWFKVNEDINIYVLCQK